jgi:hypothetical protein
MLLFLIIICILGLLASMAMLRTARSKGILPAGMLSGVLSLGTFLIVIPEYGSLSSGNTQDILERVGGYSLTSILAAAPGAMKLLSLCLLSVIAGEAAVVFGSKNYSEVAPRRDKWRPEHSRYFVAIAIVIGTVSRVALSGQQGGTLAGRGTQSGLGFLTTGGWLLVCAIIILMQDKRSFRRPIRYLLIVFCAGITLASYLRTPLLLVVCYIAILSAGAISRRHIKIRSLFTGAALAYVLLIALSVISIWRASKVRHLAFSFSSTLSHIAVNPITSLPTAANVNTFDGAIFTQMLQAQGIHASPQNWLVALTTFVPSQLWPGKPTSLSIELSSRYLHFGASGMFLSGAGFSSMTLYGTVGAMAAWFIMASLSTLFIRRRLREPFDYLWCAIAVFFVITMWFEGDAFNIYYTLTILIVSWLCLQMARACVSLTGHRYATPISREATLGSK